MDELRCTPRTGVTVETEHHVFVQNLGWKTSRGKLIRQPTLKKKSQSHKAGIVGTRQKIGVAFPESLVLLRRAFLLSRNRVPILVNTRFSIVILERSDTQRIGRLVP